MRYVMRKTWVIALLLAGCATSRSIYTPDGRKGFAIDCSGGAMSWGDCMEKAGEICGSAGYDTFGQTSDQTFMAANGFAGMAATRSMTIACH